MNGASRIEVSANGVDFVAFEKGEGPLLLCLHGFPDLPMTFRHQLDPLARAGYRVVVPYMRGYAPTSAPADGLYQTVVLGRDVTALIEALGADRAVLLGHDWGALAAYAAAVREPERISKLVTIAVPYGPQFATAYLSNVDQLKRSWYVYFFQMPMADPIAAADGCALIRRLWADWSPTWRPLPAEAVDPVCEALGDERTMAAALGYYRAMFDPARQDPALADEQALMLLAPITVPTLYIHGVDDGCMGVELCEGMEEAFPAGLTKLLVPSAGHFAHQEKPDEVNRAILDFLRAG